MKILLAILIVAVLAQVSLAEAMPQSKRDAVGEKTSYQLLKGILSEVIPNYRTVAQQLPKTDAYNKYRGIINEIVTFYDTQSEDLLCFQKHLKTLALMKDLMERLHIDKGDESKKVLELFAKLKDTSLETRFSTENAPDPTPEEVLEVC